MTDKLAKSSDSLLIKLESHLEDSHYQTERWHSVFYQGKRRKTMSKNRTNADTMNSDNAK